MTYSVSRPNRAHQILWHGFWQMVEFQAPLEIQKRMEALANWTRHNGGTLPPWAQPASPPAFDATAKLPKLQEGDDA